MTQIIMLEFARIEAAHLAGLVGQFIELLDDSASVDEDAALARLVPDAYRDDDAAAQEFRDLTQDDLLARRRSDATLVLRDLPRANDLPDSPDDAAMLEQITIALSHAEAQAWMRTLAAVRLVLATRLGITDTDTHAESDPRFGIYDWLGYRLHVLVEALEAH
ncbi:DUF2017 family protein [Microbacterium sp. C7(2022)]|uniref:DUF2017 family protein n=1 Tax=Microbacterium sp. C7(2022) TaxID=2992759 RepID=UPI00237AA7E4|nr:DUF2017 family protein [Microbacterium sp. C7(2022)]MDE0546940.1 DUF2017 domain-containing protein [Microbacterium sp. C7(2022)]